ncbi:MAG: MFS transporter [Candidatus Lokiarchaeota archaeon]|nr:MFS transporter [Candidatus Lokiarchaeota archaeon]
MSEIKKEIGKRQIFSYFKYMIFILIFVEILDTYTTNNLNVVVSEISAEFFPDLSGDAAISLFQIFVAIGTLGMYFVFLNQYLADRVGRKFLLVFTVFGMGIASLFINFSTNIIVYTVFLFLLYFFFNTDIWVIYINEESPSDKRAFYTNFVLIGGVIGALLIPVFHDIIINWRGMTYFAIILGIPLSIIIFFTFKETSKYLEIKEDNSLLTQKPKMFKENIKKIFKSSRRKEFIVILIISLIIGLNNLFILVGEDFLSDSFTKEDVDTVVWVMGIASIIGYFITGVTADRIGRRVLCYLYSILFPVSILIIVLGVNFSEGALTMVMIGAGLANLSYWGLRILISIMALEIIPTQSRGTGAGLKTLVSSVGITVGLIISSIITFSQGLAVSFTIFSLLFIAVFFLVLVFLKETKGVDLSKIE